MKALLLVALFLPTSVATASSEPCDLRLIKEIDASPSAQWTCPGFVDTWVKSPMLPVRAAARTLGG